MNGQTTPLENPTREKLDAFAASNEPVEIKWQKMTHVLANDNCTPDQYRIAWNQLTDDSNHPHDWPLPIWFPSENVVQDSNVYQWMQDLGLKDYRDFHRWSVEHRETFWEQSIERTGIRFETPPTKIVSPFDHPGEARWLPGAKMNIVDSCFSAHENNIAIKVQKPGQPIREISFGQLETLTNRIANSFIDAGFSPGDAIGVVLPMTDVSVALYLGIIRAGLVVVSIADSFAAPQIQNRLQIANAKAVVTYDQMTRAGKPIPLYQRVCESGDIPAIVIPETEVQLNVELRPQDSDWTQFLSNNEQFKPHLTDSEQAINILFSSGTTGDPKAIPWTHQTPIKCAVDGFIHQDIHQGHVVAWPTNLGWMMGPWLIFASLVNRACIALYEDAPMGDGFGRFVQDAKVNMLGVVPTIVQHWRMTACMESYDWSNIHVFSSTGESSHPDDMFYLSALAGMKPIIEYCGGTEIGGGYITSTVVQPNIASAFSTPAAGLDVCIVDDQQHPSDTGELYLAGPSIGLSNRLLNRNHQETYYDNTPTIDGNILRKHGDQFQRLGNGYFVAGGRIDDTMNLGGIKVSSSEIERVLNRIDGIKETAAIALAEDGGPDRLVVFVVWETEPNHDTNATIKEMNNRLKNELNPLFKVADIRTIDALPRTASNKVMRRKLRDACN